MGDPMTIAVFFLTLGAAVSMICALWFASRAVSSLKGYPEDPSFILAIGAGCGFGICVGFLMLVGGAQ